MSLLLSFAGYYQIYAEVEEHLKTYDYLYMS